MNKQEQQRPVLCAAQFEHFRLKIVEIVRECRVLNDEMFGLC